jgi:hypothetical protein
MGSFTFDVADLIILALGMRFSSRVRNDLPTNSDYFIVETDADPLPDRVLTPRPDWNNADDSAICASVMDVLCGLDARPMSTATELDTWLDSVIAVLRSAEDHVPHLDRGQQPVALMSSNTRAVFRRSKWLARQLKSPLHPSWKNT